MWKYQDMFTTIKLFNNERRNMMSKFWARVKFKEEKNAEYLIKAFFQNFNPESSIVIRGDEAKLEIVFREPPMVIVDAINHCKIIELNYGKNLKEYEEEKQNSEQFERKGEDIEKTEQPEQKMEKTENSEQSKQESEKSKDSEQTEKRRKKNDDSVTQKKEVIEKEIINIPELEEIAQKATSFDNFAELIAKWLEMDKRQEFFKNLIIVSANVDKIKWKELEKALNNNNISYKLWDKAWVTQQVSEKLKEQSITILQLLKAIVEQYKGYSFKQKEEQSQKENSTEQVTENNEKNSKESIEADSLRPRVKMDCMPEIKDFEETLASVDKTRPVEERVRYVLEAMGLRELPAKEQEQIIEIASTAVRKERMAFDIIFVEANIPIEQTMTVRMTFSKFVNDFVQKYESDRKVKLLTFLSELQKIIMLESEIENFSDFTDM